MASYQIIDEPGRSVWSHLIVSPVIILLASIFVPLFIDLPFRGKIWMPFLWFVINSYCLSSPTFKKETVLAILGCGLWFCSLYALTYIAYKQPAGIATERFFPYIRIIQQGILFLFLYFMLNLQSRPYAIYEYLNEQAENE